MRYHLWHQKVVINLLNQFKIKFHIDIDDETFQFLNCVIGQKIHIVFYRYFVNWLIVL